MSLRSTTLSLVLAAGLAAACSSSGGTGTGNAARSPAPTTSPMSGPAHAASSCAEIRDVAARLPGLTALMRNPANAMTTVSKDLAAIEHLRPSVPAKVRPAVDDVHAMLTKAKAAIANPTPQHITAVRAAGARLPQDSRRLHSFLSSSDCS